MTEEDVMGYRGKIEEQQRARELRAMGWTLDEIADELAVAKSSVSLWVRDVALPAGPLRRRASVRSPNRLQQRRLAEIAELDDLGAARLGELHPQAFLAAGAALYAGEGSKTEGSVRFANSDPAMVAFFCRWLRAHFSIDERRLRAQLYLHEGLDLARATQHWSVVTAIPETQFLRPYRAIPDPSIRRTKHIHGCCTVRYSCSRTHRAVMGLVRALLSSSALLPG